MSGIEIEFVNRERLKHMPPAIYVGNHVSMLDVVIAVWILPVGTTADAKKQVIWLPLFEPECALSGSIMVDRDRPTVAIAPLKKQAEFLVNNGFSVAIWPEGTRSRSGHRLPFQNGFAHIALWTRLPIVPVAISGARTARKIGGSGFRITRDSLVRIETSEPIETKDWSRRKLPTHIDEVHRVFRERLSEDQRPVEQSEPQGSTA